MIREKGKMQVSVMIAFAILAVIILVMVFADAITKLLSDMIISFLQDDLCGSSVRILLQSV